MKSEPVKIDVKQTLQIIRANQSADDALSTVDGSSSKLNLKKFVLPAKKKPVNIPICEVNIDEEYETSIPVVYSLPPSYVKHIRKIVEDSDVGTDYIADKDDMQWVQTVAKHYPPSFFNIELFESIINNLERNNGHQRDTVTQSVALRAISGKFDLTNTATQKLVSDVYKYWVAKRDKWGKPLVRKFWPLIPSTDTNPHLVFRVRDRERYRLRRHRRNDLDSFRKLQQFRREFEQAKNIAQLILERESIAELDFMAARDIFTEEAKELGYDLPEALNFKTDESTNSLVYEPLFKHLWVPMNTVLPDLPPTEFDILADDASDCTSMKESKAGNDNNNGNLKNNKYKGHKNNEDGRLSALTMDGNLEGVLTETKKGTEKKKKKDKIVLYGNDGVEILDVAGSGGAGNRGLLAQKGQKRGFELGTNDSSFLGYSRPSILDEELPLTVSPTEESGLESKLIHDDLDGPKIICRPSWPYHYEKNAQGRGRVFMESPEDYLESLELRRDEYGEPMVPHKYRIRYRVGRGGRLIADKIPIYRNTQEVNPSDEEEEVNEDSIRYFYPTQYRPIPLVGNRDTRAFPLHAGPSAGGNTTTGGNAPITTASGRHSGGGTSDSFSANNEAQSSLFPLPMTASTVSGPSTKQLPELPNSNRRVMHQVRKYGRLSTPGYAWCGSTIPPFSYLPPTVPPGPITNLYEKQERLQQAINAYDSEDEEILVDHSCHDELGEFTRLLQKQAESLTTAAQAVQATATSQKKNQQQQQLARIKMSLEV